MRKSSDGCGRWRGTTWNWMQSPGTFVFVTLAQI